MDIIVNEAMAREWFLEQLRLFPQLPVLRLSQRWHVLAMKGDGLDDDEWVVSVYASMMDYQVQLQILHGVSPHCNISGRLHPILLRLLQEAGKLEIT